MLPQKMNQLLLYKRTLFDSMPPNVHHRTMSTVVLMRFRHGTRNAEAPDLGPR